MENRSNRSTSINQSVTTLYPFLSDSLLSRYPGAEHIDYDFASERADIRTGTNLLESTAFLVKGCLGAGILGIHEAFKFGGLWASLAIALVLGLLVSYNMMILVQSAQTLYQRLRIPTLSYPDLAQVAISSGPIKCLRKYSKCFRYTVDIFIVIAQLGACCVYQIVIAVTLKQALENTIPILADMNIHTRIYILVIIVPLLLLCTVRTLKHLIMIAIAADVGILIAIAIYSFYTITSLPKIEDKPSYKDAKGLFYLSGLYIFTIQGIGIVLPMENHMKRPKTFGLVLLIGMPIVIVISCLMGFLGYWAWGEDCFSPITIQLPSSFQVIIMQYICVVVLSVTFTITFWVPFKGVWHYLSQKYERNVQRWEKFHRALQVLIISAFSLFYPHIMEIMLFLGGFCLIFIGFIFPSVIDTLVFWKSPRKGWFRWRLAFDIFNTLFGFFIMFGIIFVP